MQKVCVITGASSGIGLAVAKLMLEKGFTVYGISKGDYAGDDFVNYNADVNDAKRMEEILNEIFEKEGRIDVFCNNAGFGISGELANTKPEVIQSIFSTNLTAYAVNISLVGSIMKKQGFGNIINTSSLASIFPLPYQSCYSATKAGVDALARTARTELKPYNVYVSLVVPGDVSTGFTDARIKSKNDDAKIDKSIEKIERYERKGMSPQAVAKKIVKLATSKKPKVRVCVGSLKMLVFLQKILPIRTLDWLIKVLYC